MSVKIRLARSGAKKAPYYRIVVTDSRKKRDGRFIEKVGTYNPIIEDKTKRVVLDSDRIKYWLGVGAQTSDRVQKFLFDAGLVKEDVIKKSDNVGLSKKAVKKKIEEEKEEAKKAADEKKAAKAAAAAAATEAASSSGSEEAAA